MFVKKNTAPAAKSRLHPRNQHGARYDLELLKQTCPALQPHILRLPNGSDSIDFANPEAVKILNTALLMHHYGLSYWDIPPGYLCPPIPGRADYIHQMADLLSETNDGRVPRGSQVRCLDIGVGANAVYPIIGRAEYGWSFVGTDIDPVSLEAAQAIAEANDVLRGGVEFRLQPEPAQVFTGIWPETETFDAVICNPPFHASAADAEAANLRKVKQLNPNQKVIAPALNFGGQGGELWCVGGEEKFIKTMVQQSQPYAQNCAWFSVLVAKKTHLKGVYAELSRVRATIVRTIPMGQGNKTSRMVAWTFLPKTDLNSWGNVRWSASPFVKK